MECILLDLDGTILDTADAIRKAVRETRAEFQLNIDIDNVISESLNILEGRKSRLNFLILGIHFGFLDIRHPLRIFKIKEFFSNKFSQYTEDSKLLPGIKEALQHLSAWRLAVVTARKRNWTESALRQHQILHYFDVIVTTDDVKKDKPHPGPITKAVTLLKADPAKCVYVGDLPSDTRAGKRAGVKTAAVLTGLSSRERLQREKPDFICENLQELAFLLQRKGDLRKGAREANL